MFKKIVSWLSAEKKINKENVVIVDNIMYPTESMVKNVHNKLITLFKDGNDHINRGIIQPGNISFNLYKAKYFVGTIGTKKEKVMEKASHLMYDFIVSHAFADGNKRIGFTLFLLFLLFNGINFNINLSEYLIHADFIKRIADLRAKNRPTPKEILIWFNKNNRD